MMTGRPRRRPWRRSASSKPRTRAGACGVGKGAAPQCRPDRPTGIEERRDGQEPSARDKERDAGDRQQCSGDRHVFEPGRVIQPAGGGPSLLIEYLTRNFKRPEWHADDEAEYRTQGSLFGCEESQCQPTQFHGGEVCGKVRNSGPRYCEGHAAPEQTGQAGSAEHRADCHHCDRSCDGDDRREKPCPSWLEQGGLHRGLVSACQGSEVVEQMLRLAHKRPRQKGAGHDQEHDHDHELGGHR